jgi:hypothetical protein
MCYFKIWSATQIKVASLAAVIEARNPLPIFHRQRLKRIARNAAQNNIKKIVATRFKIKQHRTFMQRILFYP